MFATEKCLKAVIGLQTITIEPYSGLQTDAESVYQILDAISSRSLTTINVDAYHQVTDLAIFSTLSQHFHTLDGRLRQKAPYELCFLVYRDFIGGPSMADYTTIVRRGLSQLDQDGRLQIVPV